MEKTKHIAVTESTKKAFDAVKKSKGMSQDGMVSYMVELVKKETKHGG